MTSDIKISQLNTGFESVAFEMKRPFMLLKPSMTKDGDKWCALYGTDIQTGVCGFGATPHDASIDFDLNWLNCRIVKISKVNFTNDISYPDHLKGID